MKTIKTTEKFDKDGNLIERVTETVETIEMSPFQPPINPLPFYAPLPQPIIIQPQQPYYRPWEITCGQNVCQTTTYGSIQ